MTAIGMLSIFFGVLGLLLSGVILVGGFQIDRNLDAVEKSLEVASDREFRTNRAERQAQQTGDELRRAERLIVLDGVVYAGLSIWILGMGVGTLRIRWWAWWGTVAWSLVSIGLLVFVIVLRPVDFSVGSWLILVYPVVLLVTCAHPAWRQAFRRSSG
ncbi:MAG TPA: hypothetical protein DEO57_08470 [Phycisphaerales bacterium]|nr:hypothetical protein [Phycisphaerales bacterium]|tara:strand:- start:481 stop:954 length:474 start_codon:yes stop_codon:yes gene_type:complete